MGRRVLVTRPQPGAGATARRLVELGFEPIVLPLTEIRALSLDPLPDSATIDAMVVTSANALRHAGPALLAPFLDKPCFAVGAETAASAAKAGFGRVVAGPGDAVGLVRLVTDSLSAGAGLLYLCGRVRVSNIEDLLRKKGMHVAVHETYDAPEIVYPAGELMVRLASEPPDAALLYSARAATALGRVMSEPQVEPLFAETVFLCISERVAVAFPGVAPERVFVAATPDEAGLLGLLGQHCGNGV